MRPAFSISPVLVAVCLLHAVLAQGLFHFPPRDDPDWVEYSGNPVLGKQYGVIFDIYVLQNPSKSTYKYAMYNSWRTDGKGNPVNAIGLSQSTDGLTWNNETVVLGPVSNTSSWQHELNRPSVLYNSSTGQYLMWYTGQTATQSFIGEASSKDGINWSFSSSSPVLSPNVSSWEKVAVMCPNVILPLVNGSIPKGYRMYYSGGDQYEPDAIGVAFSSDLKEWTKDTLNPIFTPNTSAPWEAFKVTAAQVFQGDDGWFYMFYIGFADINTASINLARSKDGLTEWQRHPKNPLLTHGAANTWNCDAVYKPFALYDSENSRWLLWFNGRCGSVEQIGVAIKQGFDLGF